MTTDATQASENKLLLVLAMPVPAKALFLFTMVFQTVSNMITYICKNLKNTDSFHLIIPIDDLEHLLNDPVYRFTQVSQIDVICNSADQRETYRRYFQPRCNKLRFCTFYELVNPLAKAELDEALALSRPIDRNAIDGILSLVQQRVRLKKSSRLNILSPTVKQSLPISAYGLPVKNTGDFPQGFVCPGCKLIYQQSYRSGCKHKLCQMCFNTQNSCTTCPRTIFIDDARSNTQMEIQHMLSYCAFCEWLGSYKDYAEHLNDDHHEMTTCIIHNQSSDEDAFHAKSPSSSYSPTSLNGTTLWKIRSVRLLRNNASLKEQKSIYSTPFYSSPGGYKMCLRLFINGDSLARNTHMSLFLVIMRGKYDERLQWPIKCQVNFTLINQLHPNSNQSNSFSSVGIMSGFQRPTANMNIPFGIPRCFPLEGLHQNQGQYVLNDTLFIKTELNFQPILSPINGENDFPNEEEHVETTEDNISDLIRFDDAVF